MTSIKYPHLTIDLTGIKSDILLLLLRFRDVLDQGGVAQNESGPILANATSLNVDHLLQVIHDTVTVKEGL